MVGQKTVIMVAVALVIVIALCVFLEIKFPIKKKGSWKRRGIWALLSLLLFMTPMRFNHDGGMIYHINRGFDNKQSFRNPERDIQINGPLLNFLKLLRLANYEQASQLFRIYNQAFGPKSTAKLADKN